MCLSSLRTESFIYIHTHQGLQVTTRCPSDFWKRYPLLLEPTTLVPTSCCFFPVTIAELPDLKRETRSSFWVASPISGTSQYLQKSRKAWVLHVWVMKISEAEECWTREVLRKALERLQLQLSDKTVSHHPLWNWEYSEPPERGVNVEKSHLPKMVPQPSS